MKKSSLLALLALSAVLAGCAETIAAPDVKPEDKPGEEPGAELQTITVGLPEEVVAPDGTKVTFTPGDNVLALNWADGDAITLIGETTETYTLKSGAGTKVAVFEGKEVVKPENGDYTVIYPSSFTTVKEFKAGNYQGQVQNGNRNTDHLKFHAMASSSSLNFSFSGENVTVNGAMKLQMKLPASLTKPTGITVAADSPVFYTTNDGSAPVSEMKLSLNNVTIGEDHMLTAYLMTSPQKVEIAEGTKLTFTVETTIEEKPFKYEKTITPGAISIPAGKLNVITLNAENWKRHSGSGTADDPYLLYAVEDLQAMRSFLVHGQKVWFKLMDDINMKDIDNWEPLNWEDPYDCGIVFDGNRQTLSNLKSANRTYAGFAGVLYGELHHVTFENAKISNNHNCGVIGGFIGTAGRTAYVHDVSVTGESAVTVTGTYDGIACGGLASNAREATVENCTVNCTVVNESDSSASTDKKNRNATGGIIGKTIGSECSLTGLTFTGSVKSNTEKYTGGILGWQLNSGVNIMNCTVNNAKITSGAERVGGIVGHFEGGTISGCTVEGSECSVECSVEKPNDGWNTGGIAGIVSRDSQISNCKVEASVSSKGHGVGGILGTSENAVTITRCEFSGKINGRDSTGGIVGLMKKNSNSTVRDCKFSGTINDAGQRVGGIVGELAAWGQIYNCISTGNITGWQVVGGICGRAAGEGWNNDTDVFNIVEKCLVWGGTITATREDTDGGSSAVVVGYTSRRNQLTDCFRSSDVGFNISWPSVTPYDQNNSKNQENYYLNCNEIPGKTFNFPYHGKVSAGKACDKAKALGWDTSVWDLSKDVPALILE